MQDEIDCLVIHGNGASDETLSEAGVDRADLLIAVTEKRTRHELDAFAAALKAEVTNG